MCSSDLDSIGHNIVDTRMHITGGLGAVHGIEGFGPEYDLPNKEAFDETCAAVGNVFFNHRMFLLTQDARYMDVAEVALLNNVLAGVNLEGNRFFYINPLEADGIKPFNHGNKGRSPWFGTACCPSNLARLIPQVPGLMYATRGNEIYCSFYGGCSTTISLDKGEVSINQQTGYPFEENIRYTINPENQKQEFTLHLRIPTWCGDQFVPGKLYNFTNSPDTPWQIKVNGKKMDTPIDKGFAAIKRKWKKGDVVELYLPMPVRFSETIREVEANIGRTAVTRGPLVYCAEGVDNENVLPNIFMNGQDAEISVIKDDVLKGFPLRKAIGYQKKGEKEYEPINRRLMPYFHWKNR